MIGFRADARLRENIEKWGRAHPDKPRLSDAIRRLVELGLTVKTKERQKNEDAKQRQDRKQRAHELAGIAVDKMTDITASRDHQAGRKRRLIAGPEEFQSVRRDRPNRK
jgi:hypothetical protein